MANEELCAMLQNAMQNMVMGDGDMQIASAPVAKPKPDSAAAKKPAVGIVAKADSAAARTPAPAKPASPGSASVTLKAGSQTDTASKKPAVVVKDSSVKSTLVFNAAPGGTPAAPAATPPAPGGTPAPSNSVTITCK